MNYPIILRRSPLVPLCLFAACALAAPASRAGEFKEDFTGVADKTGLESLDGWKLHYGKEQGASADLGAGYSGLGARFSEASSYRLTIPDDLVLATSETTGEFRVKVRVMAENDGYGNVQIMLGAKDGVHGLAVCFNGGNADGTGDNYIQISSGGENWGRIQFEDIKEAAWEKDIWYEVAITDIAEDGSGKVTVREADSSRTLVENAPIHASGNGRLPAIDTIIIGNRAAKKVFDIDDISLKSLQ